MAVVDEAPVFALTSYNVTVFFKRSDDVRDKRLWASEPVWINQTDPSACAMWALVLQQAEKLRSWKALLPRAEVPPNVEEKIGSPLCLGSLSHLEAQVAAESMSTSSASLVTCSPATSSPAVSSKRGHAEEQQTDIPRSPVSLVQRGTHCPSLNLQACSPYSKAPQNDGCASAPEPAAVYFVKEGIMLLSELGLTGEILDSFEHGKILKVSLRAPYMHAPVLEAPVFLHAHPGLEPSLLHCLPLSALASGLTVHASL